MKKLNSSLTNSFLFFIKNRVKRFVFCIWALIISTSFESLSQTTYIWNQTGTADWTVAANWTPSRTPATNDILQFNNGAITTPTNISTETIGQLLIAGNTIVNLQGVVAGTVLTISNLPGDDLSVALGSQLNINVAVNTTTIALATGATGNITGNMTFSAAAHRLDPADANAVTFNSPAIFTQGTGCTGNVFTNTLPANAIIFSAGTIFLQSAGANPFGLTQPLSKVIFNTGSLYIFQDPSGTPSFSGRTYANFQFTGSGAPSTCVGGNAVSINNFNVTSGTINVNMTGTPGHSIKGNVSVAAGATLNFAPATVGTINLNGTAAQAITNSGTITFAVNEAVTINNPAGVIINNNITLNDLVTFTAGIVTVPNPTVLTLSSTASVASVSNASFVDGKVAKIGNTAFTFPVGATSISGYVPISISAPSIVTDVFTAKYIRSSAPTGGLAIGLKNVSSVDYWTLDRTGGSSTVNVTLNWTSQSSNGGSTSYITDLPSLTVAHYDGTNWDTYSGELTATGTVVTGSITRMGVSVFSPFSLGSVSFLNPLPINLNYLNGIKQNGSHNLAWKVTCTNNSSATMSLERCADNRNFKDITTITADALRCEQPFNYSDDNPLAGTNYYRLKMTDANGKVSYSAAIAILNVAKGFDIVGLLPTLVNNNAILNITAAQKTKMDMVVTDIAGKQVQKIVYNLIAGSNQFNINLSNLSAGTYQITGYTPDGKSRTIRFTKQ